MAVHEKDRGRMPRWNRDDFLCKLTTLKVYGAVLSMPCTLRKKGGREGAVMRLCIVNDSLRAYVCVVWR